ncbi:sialin [Galendromus occidentalis]|uniref:Sialin n=1 Tax=Galendromus occidentalis TaxID=34638 RepID=A0AAJ6QNE1_9ACAR|nr:sialin [Galendromus occidentalis]
MENVPLIRARRTGFIRHRYVVCMFVFTGLALVYALRVNLSVAIIAMAGSIPRNGSELEGTCILPETNETAGLRVRGDFDWNEQTKAAILGAFFYGYLSTQIIGGIMAQKLSVKWVFGYGIFLTSVLSVTTEWVARWNVNAFIVLRVLEGITEGVTVPTMYCLISRWAPKNERTTMSMLCTVGTNIGTVITMPITAALSDSALGWSASFYLPGAAGIIWSLAWYICVTSQPENHRWISAEEREYIMKNRETCHLSSKEIPWVEILTSRGVWMYSIARLLSSVTFYMFLTEMPTFVDQVFGIPLTGNGLLNGVFHSIYACALMASAALSDYMIHRNVWSRTNIRKAFQCASFVVSGAMLILATMVGCDYYAVTFLLCIASVAIALSGGGESSMALDLAPDHAASVAGVGNTIGNVAAIIATNLVLAFHDPLNSQRGWNKAFIATAGLSFVGALIFGIFATAVEEPWSKRKDSDTSKCEGKFSSGFDPSAESTVSVY